MKEESPPPNPAAFDRWLDDWQLPLPPDLVKKLYDQAWLNGWNECDQIRRLEDSKGTAEYAMMMLCCAKAIHWLERTGLKRDARTIREELATMGIEVQILPDPTFIEENQ
jgi:hypothetical protein